MIELYTPKAEELRERIAALDSEKDKLHYEFYKGYITNEYAYAQQRSDIITERDRLAAELNGLLLAKELTSV